MHPRNARDFYAGCLFLAFGLAFFLLAQGYPLGSARRMGPAYFPVVLSLILIVIGVAVVARALLAPAVGPGIRDVAGKALVLVTGGIVLFGVLVQGAGLAVAVPVLVLVSAAASRNSRPVPVLVLGAGLAAFCVGVFVKGLGLPYAALGPWLWRP